MSKQGKTGISWTDATWNPVVGCTKVSEGCWNCWAEKAARLHYHSEFPNGWDGTVKTFPDRLEWPLHRQKPIRIAVGLMGDLFHEDVPFEFIERVFDVIRKGQKHVFQLLTKRPQRALDYWSWRKRDYLSPIMHSIWPSNAWLGVSVENQATADERIPLLLQIPAAVRFVSAEPLIGPIKLTRHHAWCPTHDYAGGFCTGQCPDRRYIDWLIVGGESGPGARPIHPDWARSVRDQCQTAGVPFHFKGWGEWEPLARTDGVQEMPFGDFDVDSHFGFDRVGKKAAGRLLDGREWLEFPEAKQ